MKKQRGELYDILGFSESQKGNKRTEKRKQNWMRHGVSSYWSLQKKNLPGMSTVYFLLFFLITFALPTFLDVSGSHLLLRHGYYWLLFIAVVSLDYYDCAQMIHVALSVALYKCGLVLLQLSYAMPRSCFWSYVHLGSPLVHKPIDFNMRQDLVL